MKEDIYEKNSGFFLALALTGAMGLSVVSADTGTYTGVGQGIDGDVVVQVEADENTIYSIEILEQNETPGIGSVACEILPGQIVDANSILVDDIAGATVTSSAIKTAVREALAEGNIDPAAFEVAQESTEAEEKTSVALDCDVVIVGAGGAGLTAAVRATQEGAKVLVIEKRETPTGIREDIGSIDSKLQLESLLFAAFTVTRLVWL